MNKETLDEIENFGKLAFTPEQVAIIVGVSPEAMKKEIEDKAGEMYMAYYRGVFKREGELRTVLMDQALSGSTPAAAMANDLFQKLKLELMG